MDDFRYRLLDGVADDLATYVAPALGSSAARNRTELAIAFLRYLAAEVEQERSLAEGAGESLLRATEVLVARLEEHPGGTGGDSVIRQAVADVRETWVAAPDQVQTVRRLLADAIRGSAGRAADGRSDPGFELLRESMSAEARWVRGIRAIQRDAAGRRSARDPGEDLDQATSRLTPENLTRYLRRRFPNAPRLQCTNAAIPSVGRSKSTVFLTLADAGPLPSEVVLRQDARVDFRGIGTSVLDEEPVLRHLADAGLPVPDLVHLEREETELGPPFMLTARLPGRMAGEHSGWFGPGARSVVEDVARALAALHGMDASTLEIPGGAGNLDPRTRFLHTVDEYRRKWQRLTVEPSPIVEYAFAWLESEAGAVGTAATTLVHGDVRPHNMVVEDDRLTGLADWELVHLGDPAEDLAYFRSAAELVVSWPEFLDVYAAAGGAPIDARRLKVFGVLTTVRNHVYIAACSHRFMKEAGDMLVGMTGFNNLRINDDLLAAALEL